MSPTADPIDVVVSFDTTGSMYPCLTQVRREVGNLVKRLFKNIPNLHIGIIGHGDYCDGKDVITTLDLTDHEAKISDFVGSVPSTYGGDAPECYELVLNRVRGLKWRSGKSKVLVLIADDVPHGPSYPENKENLDWRNELGLLLEQGIHVYAVQALARRHATSFYKEVAEKTGGFHLSLPQFNAINDLIMAICYRQDGEEALKKYEEEVEKKGKMTAIVGANFDRMLGREVRHVPSAVSYSGGTPRRASTSSVTASGDIDESKLEPVHPSRFQVLGVDADCAIKGFVNDNGLTFNTGRGFYQFTKSVKVQNYKEVVLVNDTTGSMFSGAQARQMLGLPKAGDGGTVNLRPGTLKGYTAYIQSTSHNRKLIAGTAFLYELPDYEKPGVSEAA